MGKNEVTTTAVEAGFEGQSSSELSGRRESIKENPVSHTLDVQDDVNNVHLSQAMQELDSKKKHWYSYMLTKEFWMVLGLGQVLSLCITGTNTLSTFLQLNEASLPAFQNFLNYVLLTLIYIPLVLYKYGWKRYTGLYFKEGGRYGLGWKYFILSFLDVQGNYFTVLAYRYTNLLSAQLLNFWSIVMVVAISFVFLKVRYGWTRVAGILICCGGMGLLLASDSISSGTGAGVPDQVKGDLFGLLGATFYGMSNVYEEWFVSKRPAYETLSFLGFFGMLILGVQTAIFERDSFEGIVWTGDIAGYLVGYAIVLTIFYSLAPFMFRLGSAAFFDISLLTANFWGVIIGINVFGYTIYYLYPIAFVMIIVGLVVYFVAGSVLGDSKKPWLGENQELGFAGWGTAKAKALKLAELERTNAAQGAHLA